MTQNEYGEIYNGEDTYQEIIHYLNESGRFLIGWTDQLGTHFDILFVNTCSYEGTNKQGGIRPRSDLFVSIMRIGCFAFEIGKTSHPSYYGEKLGLGDNATTEKLTELINEIRIRL